MLHVLHDDGTPVLTTTTCNFGIVLNGAIQIAVAKNLPGSLSENVRSVAPRCVCRER